MSIEYLAVKNNVIEHINQSVSKITPSNITNLILYTMNTVEKISKSSGPEKKNICTSILYDVINNADINIVDSEYVNGMLNNILDPFIENIIQAARGKLDINSGFFTKLFSCCKKNDTK